MDEPADKNIKPPTKKAEVTLPLFEGLEEVHFSQSLTEKLGRSARDSMFINNPGMTYLAIKYYVSDDALVSICNNVDRALMEAGFKALSAKARLDSKNSPTRPHGAYTKVDGPDLLLTVNYAKRVLEKMQAKSRANDDPMLEFMIPLENRKYAVTIIVARGMATPLNRYINKTFK